MPSLQRARSYPGETISLKHCSPSVGILRESSREQHIKGKSVLAVNVENAQVKRRLGWFPRGALLSTCRRGQDSASPNRRWLRSSVSRTGSRGRYGSSSSPTGLNKEFPNQAKASSISSVKYIKRRSSSARMGPSRSTVGESRRGERGGGLFFFTTTWLR